MCETNPSWLLESESDKKKELEREVSTLSLRFPLWFDERLKQGAQRLKANSSMHFLKERSSFHLKRLVLVQFFLQKRIEASFNKSIPSTDHFFLKIFRSSFRVCIALAFFNSHKVAKQTLVKIIQVLLPGISEVPNSSFLWQHPDFPYQFCYLEVQKMRGVELTAQELKKIEKSLKEQLRTISPLTPALFWPYNEEDSFRQVELLLKQIDKKSDLPHVSIQFQEQTGASLEFLVHLARPQAANSLQTTLKKLPDYLNFFCHFEAVFKRPFPIEIGAFALKVPSHAFDTRDSINLLYARRYVMKYLEEALGSLRDYNGGLFEKQQQHFEFLRGALADKIPLFEFFAEKLFYALHPVEKRLMLSEKDAEELFELFSLLLQESGVTCKISSANQALIMRSLKNVELRDLSHYFQNSDNIHCQAQFSLGGEVYFCALGENISALLASMPQEPKMERKILRLFFEEGRPASLNPYYSASDMRCRLLSKLLFEGLTRLDKEQKPLLAAALECQISEDQKLYTFKLRPNYWSNGERVTAMDYANSLKQALKSHFSHPEIYDVIKNAKNRRQGCLSSKLGVRALDSQTLQVELEYPDPDFLQHLAQPFFFPLFGLIQEPKWFNGPFLVRKQSEESILLEKNPYYWNSNSLFFEEIEVQLAQDLSSLSTLFLKRKLDWVGDPLSALSASFLQRLIDKKELRCQEVSREFILSFNTTHPVLSSALIRRALSGVIDRSFICQEIFPLNSASFNPLTIEESQKIFREGLQQLKLSLADLPPFILSYSHQERREKLALYLKECWQKQLGITVQVEKTEWNQFRNRLEKGWFDIAMTICDTKGNHSTQYLKKLEGPSSWNFSKWIHPRYQSLLAKADQIENESEKKGLIEQIKTLLAEELPFTSLFKYTHLYAHAPHLSGYLIDEEGCVDFSQSYLKLEKTL